MIFRGPALFKERFIRTIYVSNQGLLLHNEAKPSHNSLAMQEPIVLPATKSIPHHGNVFSPSQFHQTYSSQWLKFPLSWSSPWNSWKCSCKKQMFVPQIEGPAENLAVYSATSASPWSRAGRTQSTSDQGSSSGCTPGHHYCGQLPYWHLEEKKYVQNWAYLYWKRFTELILAVNH